MLRDYEVLGTELRTVTYKARNLIPDYFSIVSLKGVLVSQLCCLFQIALDILEALLYTWFVDSTILHYENNLTKFICGVPGIQQITKYE